MSKRFKLKVNFSFVLSLLGIGLSYPVSASCDFLEGGLPLQVYSQVCSHLSPAELKELRLVSKKSKESQDDYRKYIIQQLAGQIKTIDPMLSNEQIRQLLTSVVNLQIHREHLKTEIETFIETNGYAIIRNGSPLLSFIKAVKIRDASESVIAYFDPQIKKILLNNSEEAELEHLKAALPVSFYELDNKNPMEKIPTVKLLKFVTGEKNNKNERRETFKTFIEKEQEGKIPTVAFSNNLLPNNTLLQRPCEILITDQQLHTEEGKLHLQNLLEVNSEHKISLVINNDSPYFSRKGSLYISKDDLPNNLKHLKIVDNYGLVCETEKFFLSECESLESFDTSSLSSLKTLKSSFLFSCPNLKKIDTRGLINVTYIEDFFMSKCKSLESFDTSYLTNLTSIKNLFLYGCQNLETIDTKGLISVRTIGINFLRLCFKLENFDSRSLTNLTSIGPGFLAQCKNLNKLDIKGFYNVTLIGRNFLDGCDQFDANLIRSKILRMNEG